MPNPTPLCASAQWLACRLPSQIYSIGDISVHSQYSCASSSLTQSALLTWASPASGYSFRAASKASRAPSSLPRKNRRGLSLHITVEPLTATWYSLWPAVPVGGEQMKGARFDCVFMKPTECLLTCLTVFVVVSHG